MGQGFRDGLFQVVTALTTTGFQTVPSFAVWSSPLIMVMTLLMLIGGGTGSTAGGIKQIRVCIMLKSLCWSIRSKISQKRLIHADGIYRISGYEYLKAEERLEASDFILLYLGVFAAGTFILCACGFGIGDSMFWGTLRVIATGIGTSLALNGNILGPILFWLIYNIPAYLVRYWCLKFGYGFGTSFLNKVEESGLMPKLTYGAAVIGLMVIGAMIPNMINIQIAGSLGAGDSATAVQGILDGIMPSLLPLMMTLGVYGLLQKKVKVSWVLVILTSLGIIGALFGIFVV